LGKKLVLDATPLIYLSKIRLWAHLHGFELLTTPQVLAEAGVSNDAFPEAALIRQMLEAGGLKERLPEKTIHATKNLHEGEASAISLAKHENAVLVADDSTALAYAKSAGLKTAHSSTLLVRALKKRAISFSRAKQLLDEMIDEGWYCDVSTYKRVLAALEKYK